MFYVIMPSLDLRQRLIAHLQEREIQAVFHYQPLHLSEMGRHFGGKEGDFPVTERVSDRLVRLPFHNLLTGDEQEQVMEAVLEFGF
jgi:dTDP-4-amino-4,6-dideoxygalactose transaminase